MGKAYKKVVFINQENANFPYMLDESGWGCNVGVKEGFMVQGCSVMFCLTIWHGHAFTPYY